jgi:hypothetical protein
MKIALAAFAAFAAMHAPDASAQNSTAFGECAAYPACSSLSLTGECCPTIDDIFLDCCFDSAPINLPVAPSAPINLPVAPSAPMPVAPSAPINLPVAPSAPINLPVSTRASTPDRPHDQAESPAANGKI